MLRNMCQGTLLLAYRMPNLTNVHNNTINTTSRFADADSEWLNLPLNQHCIILEHSFWLGMA